MGKSSRINQTSSQAPWADEHGEPLAKEILIEKSRRWDRVTWEAYLKSLEGSLKESQPGHWVIQNSVVTETKCVPDNNFSNISAEAIEQLLSLLTPRQREIIHAIYWQGLSERQVARNFGISQSTVQDIKQRGITRIKKHSHKLPLTFPIVETAADSQQKREGGIHGE